MSEVGGKDISFHAHMPTGGGVLCQPSRGCEGQQVAGSFPPPHPLQDGGMPTVLSVHGSISLQINSSRKPGWLSPFSFSWGLAVQRGGANLGEV